MSSPTEVDILRVKTNLRNMINFNNQLYVQGNTKILNAFLLLSISDDHDLGFEIGLNLLKGAMIGIGAEGGIIGAIAANFLCGVVDSYTTTKPVSLNVQMSNLITRFQKTSEQLDVDLEMYYGNPSQYWNTTFIGSVTNAFGTYPVSCTFSDLATIDFPDETNSLFMDYILKAQYALDQQVWFTLLPNFVITKFYPSTIYPCKTYSEQKMETNAAWFYGVHKSYWNNWTYYHDTNRKGEDTSYYSQNENDIGTGAGAFTDGHLNDSACDYLFIDSYDNVIINANGLFHRSFVFTQMPSIKHKTYTYYNLTEKEAVKEEEKEAVKEEKEAEKENTEN